MSIENKISDLAKQIFEDAAASLKLPGVSYGVNYQGTLAASGDIGFADPFTSRKASQKISYPIASMTKSFVGAAILMLRDQNKLNLDDLALKYVPELKSDSKWQDITIYDLVTMRAGLPEDNPWADRKLECSDSEYSKFFSSEKNGGFIFCAPRQTDYFYSNLSYMLLGRIISKASAQQALKFISENILAPLEMTSSRWSPADSDLEFAVGSDVNRAAVPAATSIADGAVFGGLLSSVPDMLIWIEFLMNQSSKFNEILSEASRRELRNGGRICEEVDNKYNLVSYAYGLIVQYMPEARLVRFGHSGGLPGFGSRMSFIPEHQIGIVALSNLTYAALADPCKVFLEEVVKILPSKSIESPLVERRYGELLALIKLWDENKLSAVFASNFFNDNSKVEVQERFKKLNTSLNSKPLTLRIEKGLIGNVSSGNDKALTFSLAPVEEGKIQMVEFHSGAC